MPAKKEVSSFVEYPRSMAAQRKFSACKVGDTVWMPGGFWNFGRNGHSFGLKVKVSKIVVSSSNNAGLILKAATGDEARATCVMTRDSIKAYLLTMQDGSRAAYLDNFDMSEDEKQLILNPDVASENPAPMSEQSPEVIFDNKMKMMGDDALRSDFDEDLLQSYLAWKKPKWMKHVSIRRTIENKPHDRELDETQRAVATLQAKISPRVLEIYERMAKMANSTRMPS